MSGLVVFLFTHSYWMRRDPWMGQTYRVMLAWFSLWIQSLDCVGLSVDVDAVTQLGGPDSAYTLLLLYKFYSTGAATTSLERRREITPILSPTCSAFNAIA